MSNVDKINPGSVKALWSYLLKKHNGKVKDKAKSRLMRATGWTMERLGIMSKKSFMEDFWTTVKRTVYPAVGKVIGEGNLSELKDQAEKAVHEVTHIIQNLGVKTLLSKRARAKAETDANLAAIEFRYWLYGKLPPLSEFVDKLRGYDLRAGDLAYAKTKFRLHCNLLRRGIYRTTVAREAIAFLESF